MRYSLRPSVETWPHGPTQVSNIQLDMIAATLDGDVQKLEELVIANADRINDPIGFLFDEPGSRFFGHPARDQMVPRQHPDQNLFDIACGMPSGPVIWVLIAYGAKGTRHPQGTDLAMYNAIKNGRTKTVQALLQPGRSEVDGPPGAIWKPLHHAVFWNVPEVVRILISRGARVDDLCPSLGKPGLLTALQLCLMNRINLYASSSDREKCHAILRLLLDAGADIHSTPPDPAMLSSFHMFIKPWQDRPCWAFELSLNEIACFGVFASKGVDVRTPFKGCPCGSSNQDTFQHQVLWHSTPSFARLLIDEFVSTPGSDGTSLLHEILGSCPNAKRHPADTQRDIQVLLGKGVSPNGTGGDDPSPLQICLSTSPAVDVVSRLQVLLARGADPEVKGRHLVQPYVLAYDLFQEPLRSEVMALLVTNMSGKYDQRIDGGLYSWSKDHFPISKTPTYEQVIVCTDEKSDFAGKLDYMVPERVQNDFRTAYFKVISEYYLKSVNQPAKPDFPHTKEMHQTARILHLREFGLPKIRPQQDLMDTVLNTPSPLSVPEQIAVVPSRSTMSCDTTQTTETCSFSSDTTMADITPTGTLLPFHFHVNDTAISNDMPPVPGFQQWDVELFMAEALIDLSWDKNFVFGPATQTDKIP